MAELVVLGATLKQVRKGVWEARVQLDHPSLHPLKDSGLADLLPPEVREMSIGTYDLIETIETKHPYQALLMASLVLKAASEAFKPDEAHPVAADPLEVKDV